MSSEWAIIYAAGITVVGSVFIFFLSSLFNYYADKRNTKKRDKELLDISKEKFFYSVFEKRLTMYKQFCEWIYSFPSDLAIFYSVEKKYNKPPIMNIKGMLECSDFSEKDILKYINAFEKKHENILVSFELQAKLLGDNKFADTCHNLIDSFLKEIFKELGNTTQPFDKINLIIGKATDMAYEVINDFSDKSFSEFLDDFIKNQLNSVLNS
ncbi:hypothetical protein [Treponema pedis]|uniref:hypothetical protein n=1 Tax=Treponema pedis TaxID=409322 RepID=UPI003140CEF1